MGSITSLEILDNPKKGNVTNSIKPSDATIRCQLMDKSTMSAEGAMINAKITLQRMPSSVLVQSTLGKSLGT
jgi:hypothetical protein